MERDETISYAFMVMLEKLSPVERAVFVLREAFVYEYSEIAEIIDKSEVNCRKIYSRVKQKMEQTGTSPASFSRNEENQVIRKFSSRVYEGKCGRNRQSSGGGCYLLFGWWRQSPCSL